MAQFINNTTPLKSWLLGINEKVLSATATSYTGDAYTYISDSKNVKIGSLHFEQFADATAATTSAVTTSDIDFYVKPAVYQNVVSDDASYPILLGVKGGTAASMEEVNFLAVGSGKAAFNPAKNTFVNATAEYATKDAAGSVITDTYATKTEVSSLLAGQQAMVYKGVVDGSTHALPSNGYDAGWVYKVSASGTYAGNVCEVGDLVICNTSRGTSDTGVDADWNVVQTNIDGAVTGPASSVDNQVALFDGTNGKVVKAAGTVGSQTSPVFIDGGVLTACTGSLVNNISGTASYALADGSGVAFTTGYVHTTAAETISGTKTFSDVIIASSGLTGTASNATADESGVAFATGYVHTTAAETISGTKTFTDLVVGTSGFKGNLTGNVTGTSSNATADESGIAFTTGYVHTTSDETISGAKTFTDVVVGTSGFTGDLTGNVTGNVTGTASNATADAAGIAFATGYVHIASDESVTGKKTFKQVVTYAATTGAASGTVTVAASGTGNVTTAEVLSVAAACTIKAEALSSDEAFAEKYVLLKNTAALGTSGDGITWEGVTFVDGMDSRKLFGTAENQEMLVKFIYVGKKVFAEVLHNTCSLAYATLGNLSVSDLVCGMTV